MFSLRLTQTESLSMYEISDLLVVLTACIHRRLPFQERNGQLHDGAFHLCKLTHHAKIKCLAN